MMYRIALFGFLAFASLAVQAQQPATQSLDQDAMAAKTDGASHAQPAASSESSSALVAFLTTDDPMIAGHAVHFAHRIMTTGRSATLILIGEAGRLGIKTLSSPTSAVSGEPLNQDLASFIDAGGKVYISSFTLRHFAAAPEMLADGVSLPDDPQAIHQHMFDPGTQLVVW